MFRLLAVFLLSLSVALPGAAMALPGHHAHMTAAHPVHGPHDHGHHTPCPDDNCRPSFVLTCCAMMAEHCAVSGIPVDRVGTITAAPFRSAGLSPGGAQLLDGLPIEADPPPPRV